MKKKLLLFLLTLIVCLAPQALLANHAIQAVPFILGGLVIGAAILIVLLVLLLLYGLTMLLVLLNLFIKNKVVHIINLVLGIVISILYLIVAGASLKGGGDITIITLFIMLFWGTWYVTKKKIAAKTT